MSFLSLSYYIKPKAKAPAHFSQTANISILAFEHPAAYVWDPSREAECTPTGVNSLALH